MTNLGFSITCIQYSIRSWCQVKSTVKSNNTTPIISNLNWWRTRCDLRRMVQNQVPALLRGYSEAITLSELGV